MLDEFQQIFAIYQRTIYLRRIRSDDKNVAYKEDFRIAGNAALQSELMAKCKD